MKATQMQQIEGKTLTSLDIYSPVTYVPNHANGNAGHPDCQRGVIIRWSAAGVFVLYCPERSIQLTDTHNLVWG